MIALRVLEEPKVQLQAPNDGKLSETFWLMRTLWEDSDPALRTWLEKRWDEIGCLNAITSLSF